MAQVKHYDGDNYWWCEWRNHEANLHKDEDGVWQGDMIAYGEWGDLDFEEAGAVAYAFGIEKELPCGSQWAFDYYFGGKAVA